jgi:SAM-dependent methyltransferase
VAYVISNCVINLSPDKPAVFREIALVLKPGGHFAVSDIVLVKTRPDELVRDISAYVGCVSGASLLSDYVSAALAAGLRDLSIPHIARGSELVKMLAPEELATAKGCSCCGPVMSAASRKNSDSLVQQAAAAVVSIKLHGRRQSERRHGLMKDSRPAVVIGTIGGVVGATIKGLRSTCSPSVPAAFTTGARVAEAA